MFRLFFLGDLLCLLKSWVYSSRHARGRAKLIVNVFITGLTIDELMTENVQCDTYQTVADTGESLNEINAFLYILSRWKDSRCSTQVCGRRTGGHAHAGSARGAGR